MFHNCGCLTSKVVSPVISGKYFNSFLPWSGGVIYNVCDSFMNEYEIALDSFLLTVMIKAVNIVFIVWP